VPCRDSSRHFGGSFNNRLPKQQSPPKTWTQPAIIVATAISFLMYWDVVEVKPEPNYSLFVRFKDGASGRIRLSPDQLTGALAPLRDPQFFAQVFIDNGAIAWPGGIDLAPDAMHAEITAHQPDHAR
jgi:Protein of unknown function (DUF2442)